MGASPSTTLYKSADYQPDLGIAQEQDHLSVHRAEDDAERGDRDIEKRRLCTVVSLIRRLLSETLRQADIRSRRQLIAQLGKWKVHKYVRRQMRTASPETESEIPNQGSAEQEMDLSEGGNLERETLSDHSSNETFHQGPQESAAVEGSCATRSDESKESFEHRDSDLSFNDFDFDGGLAFVDFDGIETSAGSAEGAIAEQLSETDLHQSHDVGEQWASYDWYNF